MLLQINSLPVISSDRIINQTLDALLEHRGIGRLKGWKGAAVIQQQFLCLDHVIPAFLIVSSVGCRRSFEEFVVLIVVPLTEVVVGSSGLQIEICACIVEVSAPACVDDIEVVLHHAGDALRLRHALNIDGKVLQRCLPGTLDVFV